MGPGVGGHCCYKEYLHEEGARDELGPSGLSRRHSHLPLASSLARRMSRPRPRFTLRAIGKPVLSLETICRGDRIHRHGRSGPANGSIEIKKVLPAKIPTHDPGA